MDEKEFIIKYQYFKAFNNLVKQSIIACNKCNKLIFEHDHLVSINKKFKCACDVFTVSPSSYPPEDIIVFGYDYQKNIYVNLVQQVPRQNLLEL